ncbi:MAG: DUF2017 domain-containing protein [Actinomycetota bacterium]|nr:DUF2017 domain-containing protein [Actinomycetota bacterium]
MGRARIERTRHGDFRVRLSNEERVLLRRLPAELRALLEADPDDPSLRRLFPPAYDEDPGDELEYRRLMRDELLARRRETLIVLEETAGRERVRADELEAWLAALNDLRLVLGTALGVSEETYGGEGVSPGAPTYELAVYGYLSWLEEEVVAALAGELA